MAELSDERIREIAKQACSPCTEYIDCALPDEVEAAIRQALREQTVDTVSVPTEKMLDAPRQFLAYCETPGRTLQGAREHMDNCGASIDSWPEWAKTEQGHITKSGMAAIVWQMMLSAHE
jgi:hypothetical protein